MQSGIKFSKAWHFIGKLQESRHRLRLAAFHPVKHKLPLSRECQGSEKVY